MNDISASDRKAKKLRKFKQIIRVLLMLPELIINNLNALSVNNY